MPPRFGHDDDVRVDLADRRDRVERFAAARPAPMHAPVRVERADGEALRVDLVQMPMP